MNNKISYKDFLEAVVDGIMIFDTNGIMIDINEKFSEMIGYNKNEIIGMNVLDISTYKTKKSSKKYAAPIIKKLLADGCINNYETSYVKKDGTVFFAEINIKSLRDDDGNITHYIAAVLDITERIKASTRLQESEAFLRTIIHTDPNLIFVKHRNGKYIEICETLANLWGGILEDIIDKTDLDLTKMNNMSIQEAEKFRSNDLQVLNTGKQKFIPEESMTLADGTIKWYQTTKVPLKRNNKNDYLLGVSVDITERKNTLDQLKNKEAELKIKNQNLEELNTAMKVLLRQKDDNRLELEEKVLTTLKTLVAPYLNQLNNLSHDNRQQNLIKIIQTNLKEVISPFSTKLSSGYTDLTNTEIRVSDLIKNDYTNKEIAEILNISSETVAVHRKNIRKKLNIKNTKTNLRSYLKSIS